MRLRVGIDVDEVIADSVAVYLPTLNDLFGRTLTRDDLTRYQFEETFVLSPAEMKAFWKSFSSGGGWERIRPVPGAAEALGRLRARHEVVVVTGRPEEHVGERTRRWLAAHAIPHDSLVFRGETDKEAAVRRATDDGRGLDVLVEDHWAFAEAVAEHGVPVLLVDCPWNRSAPAHPLVRRVGGLVEAIDSILTGAFPGRAAAPTSA